MNVAFHLYRLQQIDTQISQHEASLAEINRLLAGDESVREARQSAEQAEKALLTAQKRLKETEFAVKEQQIKIAQVESTLYSGKVRNPKELQDLQKDIASLKKHLGTLEDQQLEAMLGVEEAEEAQKISQAALAKASAAFAEQSAGWLGQKDQLDRTLGRLQSERSAALGPVPPESLKLYENLRKNKRGVAVTTAREGSCAVCGAVMRPSEIQAARAATEPVYCTSCGRILYAG